MEKERIDMGKIVTKSEWKGKKCQDNGEGGRKQKNYRRKVKIVSMFQ